ncbi:distal tail protein Dit [Paenibacillus illinoisensis]|uniref:distal tail protein Dit n=1 Tax=Paenibacillus illinoisensis TaxID=59845 RepID=UPI00203A7E68|nr:distal tail protein Dit [Paenibacillus illinoisensis]MCM3208487.1 phage tail family protein [Paenibacillus illinoisensis]
MSLGAVLTIGGVSPKELGLGTFRNSQRPILSSTVDNTVTIPGMHGAYDFGAMMGPKQFELECAFMEKNHIELQRRVSAFAAFLLDGDGRPRTMDIVFVNSPDRKYSVRYVGSLNIDRISGLGTFTLPFTAFDPFAYSTYTTIDINVDNTVITVDSDLLVDSGYTFTLSGPQSVQIQNIGTLNVEPVIDITGSFTTLSLTVGGIEFIYSQPMSGRLVIDFKRKTARIGTQNVLMNSNARFGKIPRGTSNIIVSGIGIDINMAVVFRQKYA